MILSSGFLPRDSYCLLLHWTPVYFDSILLMQLIARTGTRDPHAARQSRRENKDQVFFNYTAYVRIGFALQREVWE